jgi:hypothetical protein
MTRLRYLNPTTVPGYEIILVTHHIDGRVVNEDPT